MVTRFFAVFFVLLGMAACGGPISPSQNTTQTISDVVPLQGQTIRSFDVPNLGEFTVKLTALTPGGSAIIGVLWGQFVNGGCTSLQSNAISSAYLGKTVLSGAVYVKGTYCIQVFDPFLVGGAPLAAPQSYTFEVSHP